MKKATTAELRKINRKKIYEIIYEERQISKQEIASGLSLSLPTVTQNLKELEELKLIVRDGVFESTGGRKPQVISCEERAALAVGAEISGHWFRLTLLNLYGEILLDETYEKEYENNENYYRFFGITVAEFLRPLGTENEKVLGIGIGIQGLVSKSGQYVTYGTVLGSTGASAAAFQKYLPLPCRLFHDSEMPALAELWFTRMKDNAFYLSLSRNLGSAMLIGGSLYQGRDERSSDAEHMTLIPGGLPCYCGRKGCMESYCSLSALLTASGCPNADTFFDGLRSGDEQLAHCWEHYLGYLALAVNSLHMLLDCEIILGGHLAPYLTEEDLKRLLFLAGPVIFPGEKLNVRIAKCTKAAISTGAAIPFLQEFLDNI